MSEPVSAKQADFMTHSTARVNIAEGAIRSGKTVISLHRWLAFILRAPRGGELVMIGRTRDAVWRNCIGPLQNPDMYGPAANMVVGNYGAPTVKILGRTVHVLGASDAKAEKVIRGMTVAGAFVDEVTVIPEEFFTQLLGRMSVPRAKLFGSTNPDNPAHWLKVKYLDRIKQLPDWRAWKFTLDDNPSLTDEYKSSIKSEFTGLWFKRFILGLWVAAEGAIYDMWDNDTHIVKHEDLPLMRRVLSVGIDYGTTNATSAVALGLGMDGRLYALDEWRYDAAQAQRRFTDQQLSAGVRGFIADLEAPPEWVIVDPAAASFKVQLASDGIHNVMNGENDVLYGIRLTASLLGSGQLFVSDRCSGIISEAPGYSWDPKATEKGEDKPIKVADHSLDAWRYAITTTETLWRPYVDTPIGG